MYERKCRWLIWTDIPIFDIIRPLTILIMHGKAVLYYAIVTYVKQQVNKFQQNKILRYFVMASY